jgi:hypothetical protein
MSSVRFFGQLVIPVDEGLPSGDGYGGAVQELHREE